MLQKGFIKENLKREKRKKKSTALASKTSLYFGILLILASLIFMMFNLDRAGALMSIWLPFIIVGVILVFVSQLIKWQEKRNRR